MIRKSKPLFFLLGIFISAAAIVLLATKVDGARTVSALQSADWRWIPVLVALYLSSFIPRGIRWRLMLNRVHAVSFRVAFTGVVLGYAGNNVLPARAGEFVRMEYLSRKSDAPRVTSLSSIFAERVIDGIVLLMILVSSLAAAGGHHYERQWVHELIVLSSLVFGTALLALVGVKLLGDKLIAFFEKKKENRAFNIAAQVTGKIHNAMGFFKNDRSFYLILGLSAAVWIIEGLMFVIVQRAVGLPISLTAGFFCLAVVNFGLLIPSSPGYIGVFQAMAVLALGIFKIDAEIALTIGILVHVCQFLPVTLLGLALFWGDLKKGDHADAP